MFKSRAQVGNVEALQRRFKSVEHNSICAVPNGMNVLPEWNVQLMHCRKIVTLTTCHPSRRNRGSILLRVSGLIRITPWLWWSSV
jgi:hypothetical protein